MGITGVTIWVIGVATYLLSPLDPPSRVLFQELGLSVSSHYVEFLRCFKSLNPKS